LIEYQYELHARTIKRDFLAP